MFRPSRLLLPTDFSYYSFFALKYAVALARRYRARLHIAHVVNTQLLLPLGYPTYWLLSDCLADMESCMCDRAETRLQHLLEGLARDGVQADYRIVRGVVTDEIVNLAESLETDLVVVGTHGRTGVEHALFGSVADQVARHSPAPVLTIKHPEHEFIDFREGEIHLRRVLFPTDFSPFSSAALPYAMSLCREFGATLILLHATERPVYPGEYTAEAPILSPEELAQQDAEQLEAVAAQCPGIAVEVDHRFGAASWEILEAVENDNVDLLVQPTHGRSGVARLLLGGVARRVLRRARCPVLTIRPEMAAVKQAAEQPDLAEKRVGVRMSAETSV